MKIGIICSTAGGAFQASINIIGKSNPDTSFLVLTDRECGVEVFCRTKKITYCRIEESDNKLFSIKARKYFSDNDVNVAVLFFSRLITAELFDFIPTCNIHPSLLPSFKGLNSVKKAFNEKVKFLGATLHMVDNGIDTGTYIAQNIYPILSNYDENSINKISYIQKVGLLLLFIDLLLSDTLKFDSTNSFTLKKLIGASNSFNPDFVTDKYRNLFLEFYNNEMKYV